MTEDVERQEVEDTEDLPIGWAFATIGALIGKDGVFIDGDWVESKDQDPDGAVRLLQLADIGDGVYVNKSSRYLTQAKAKELRCTFLKRDDVLIARMPDPLGRACLFPGENQPCVTVVDVCVVRPGENSVVPRWLMYAINSTDFRGAVADLQSGSTRLRISRGNLATIEFPVPPLPEQRRIVAEIERRFTQLDDAIADLKRAQARLKRYRASVLAAACEGRLVPTEAELATTEGRAYEPADVLLKRILTERRTRWEKAYLAKLKEQGKPRPKDDKWKAKYEEPQGPDTSELPELPEGWAYTGIAALLTDDRPGMKTGPFGSLLKKHEHKPTGVPVLGIENIAPMAFRYGTKIFITDKKADELKEYEIKAGDIVISRSGTVGEICVVPEGLGKARFSTNLMRICLAKVGMLSEFFILMFNGSPSVLAQVSDLCKGSTRDFLNQSILYSLVFPLPPLAEQKRIADEVKNRLASADELEAAISSGLKQAERLRQAILRDAFTGKLVAQDPTDEPASVLLERLRAARAVGDAAKKAGRPGRKPKEPVAVVGATVEKKAPAVSVAAASGTATGKRRGRPPKNRGLGQGALDV